MEVKGKYKGSSVFIKSVGRQIKVSNENASILFRHGFNHMIKGSADLKPLTKKTVKETAKESESTPEASSLNDKQDLSRLLSKISTEALSDFEGRKPADVKKDLTALEIKHPKSAGLKRLAEIVKNFEG